MLGGKRLVRSALENTIWEKPVLGRSIILIDKHAGPTSFDIVEAVSRTLGVKKAGHSGTLDPNATGLLVIALGEARKAMPVLSGLDKEYVGAMTMHGDVADSELTNAMKSFEGEITQTPPVRSAVARKPRKRKVHEIDFLGMDGRKARFRVRCEAGTYIRKIAHDLGEALGCGAHLVELRRTKVGPFTVDKSVTVDDLQGMPAPKVRKMLIPLERGLAMIGLPRIVIKGEFEQTVRNGSPVRGEFLIRVPKYSHEGGYAGVFNEDGMVICLATFSGKGGSIARPVRVFLP
jgi:H/ACA ribonucleoprotein complex subunit 4